MILSPIKGGFNLYGFVDNDGLNGWDILGLFSLDDRSVRRTKKIKQMSKWKPIDSWVSFGEYKRKIESGTRYEGDCVCLDYEIYEVAELKYQELQASFVTVTVTQYGPTKGKQLASKL